MTVAAGAGAAGEGVVRWDEQSPWDRNCASAVRVQAQDWVQSREYLAGMHQAGRYVCMCIAHMNHWLGPTSWHACGQPKSSPLAFGKAQGRVAEPEVKKLNKSNFMEPTGLDTYALGQ
jgi:hypothetical protein